MNSWDFISVPDCGCRVIAMPDGLFCRCPYRKLDPDVLMVQPTKHRLSFDTPVTLNGPSIGRILP
jgi:hypothetical protein